MIDAARVVVGDATPELAGRRQQRVAGQTSLFQVAQEGIDTGIDALEVAGVSSGLVVVGVEVPVHGDVDDLRTTLGRQQTPGHGELHHQQVVGLEVVDAVGRRRQAVEESREVECLCGALSCEGQPFVVGGRSRNQR